MHELHTVTVFQQQTLMADFVFLLVRVCEVNSIDAPISPSHFTVEFPFTVS